MITVEAGTNWEISRQAIAPELAHLAGLQALVLASIDTDFSWVEEQDEDLTVCYVNMFEPFRGGDTDTMRLNEDALMRFYRLLEVYEKIRLGHLNLSSDPGMVINILSPGGKIDKHVDDKINGSTMAVKLLGEKDEVLIRDPITEVEHIYELEVGDGFRVDNLKQGLRDLRPYHSVENKGKIKRVSLAVASSS